MAIKGCEICQKGPATKAVCCGKRVCEEHGQSAAAHDCPETKRLLAMASDPAARRAWLKANEPEAKLTTSLIDALNHLPGIKCWRTKRARGQSTEADGVLDISGFIAPDGLALYVETKNDHPDVCGCPHCRAQRDFAAVAKGAGCVVVLGVRSVQAGVDGVRMELARARAKDAPPISAAPVEVSG